MTKPYLLALKILGGFLGLVLITHVADFFSNSGAPRLFYALYSINSDSLLNSIGSLAEVITSLFGIIITVVAIIVNLSANRYTQKIIDIFIQEKLNIIVLSFFSITSLYGIWIINTVRGASSLPAYAPHAQVLIYMLLICVSIVMIVPYFYYVFHFLRPAHIISKIEKQIIQLQNRALYSKKSAKRTQDLKPTIVKNIDQLAEICKSSVNNADRSLALLSLTSLYDITETYINLKEDYLKQHPGELPFNKEWYHNIEKYFLGLNKSIIEELQNQRNWLEYKILEEFESIFVYSLGKDSKISYQTAINMTKLSVECIKNKDIILLRDVIRFFNTLLHVSIKNGDTQNTLYVFYQYYLTAKSLINQIDELAGNDPKALVKNIAHYFKHYGQLGESKQLDKVLEYSAYFLRLVNERVYSRFKQNDPEFVEEMLNIFLTVDDIPRQKDDYEALLGVRQHQAILASYYMVHHSDNYDPTPLLDKIYVDINKEPRDSDEKIENIANSILDIKQETYFEIDNLGINPIYIKRQYKEQLKNFFTRFKGVTFNE